MQGNLERHRLQTDLLHLDAEAKLFVRGDVKSLGADCVQKEMRAEHLELLSELLNTAGISEVSPEAFTRYGSARKLYHFDVDHADAY